MKKLIDLPEDIEAGTEVWVSDCMEYPYCWLKKQYYVGTMNDKVFTIGDKNDESACACGWRRAKLPEVNWNEVPIGTSVNFWDDKDMDKFHGYLVAVVNGVPFCAQRPIDMFTLEGSRFYGGYSIKTWEHVEIVEGD